MSAHPTPTVTFELASVATVPCADATLTLPAESGAGRVTIEPHTHQSLLFGLSIGVLPKPGFSITF